VYWLGQRVFRTVGGRAAADYEAFRDRGLLGDWIDRGCIVHTREVDRSAAPSDGPVPRYVLEHAAIPFVSYPYEWPFAALKRAALFHLDLQLEALDRALQFSDASAYNVQFIGARPVFIDVLSLRPYRPGDLWLGHRQFCEQFLNPLLLRALLGVPHNAWYRGSLEGIPTAELNRLLPPGRKLSVNVLSHVTLPARWQARVNARAARGRPVANTTRPLPERSYRGLLHQLRDWIAHLDPADVAPSVWNRYDRTHTYDAQALERKRRAVGAFIARTTPALVWDLGCNTGEYAELAIESGARRVIGFDTDHPALDRAFDRAARRDLAFLPLVVDAANPSPDQGWYQQERQGLGARARADALLALAVAHHLAIGRNVPLDLLIGWVTSLAPRGLVEFVQKDDPTIHQMLAWREDVFERYTDTDFVSALERHARIVRREILSTTRCLFEYERS
jgi:ribosomal protein L11 methylase PrmA